MTMEKQLFTGISHIAMWKIIGGYRPATQGYRLMGYSPLYWIEKKTWKTITHVMCGHFPWKKTDVLYGLSSPKDWVYPTLVAHIKLFINTVSQEASKNRDQLNQSFFKSMKAPKNHPISINP